MNQAVVGWNPGRLYMDGVYRQRGGRGGSPEPQNDRQHGAVRALTAAVAEAMKTLEAAKIPVASAYAANNNAFPVTASPPFPTTRDLNAVYIAGVSYRAPRPDNAFVVVR
jgi:hypothetical protein